MKIESVVLAALAIGAASCSFNGKTGETATLVKNSFGRTGDGQEVSMFTLRNSRGSEVDLISYGAIVKAIRVPDKKGQMADVVLGFDSLQGYLGLHPYFGAVVGRYGNRIAKGKFTLNGKEYTLATNNGPNALHGGLKGFDKKVWSAKELPAEHAVEFTTTSADGEEGYPGNLTASVKYTWNDDNELKVEYTATTDKPTVLNLTNHSYFNLAGQGNGDILGQQIQIDADRFTPVDKTLIPTGELKPVEGTPFDFRKPRPIGERINAQDEQIQAGGGYDHNFVVNGPAGTLRHAARAFDPVSGRVLDVSTTQPGIQFYTGNFLDGSIKGKQGQVYQRRYAFCLETQHFPDSPNHPNFPTSVLNPGEKYDETTVFKFSTE